MQSFLLTVRQAPDDHSRRGTADGERGQHGELHRRRERILRSDRRLVVSTNGVRASPIVGATSTTLNVTSTQSLNGNIYRATFTNVAGSVTTDALFTVGTAPDHQQCGGGKLRGGGRLQHFTVTTSGIPECCTLDLGPAGLARLHRQR